MKPITRISKHLNTITKENLFSGRRILNFQSSQTCIWTGTKRYAH
ncbi:hypothetical protein [Thalassobellus suaedae]|uniref:Ribosomal protein L32 n=1 Tax=Thalassobellus suaedae TaxID=3074124 RepID=A0ABY9XXJ8_9FLAO|nr:hypothetical protein RHP51_06670 [Flavobacteriaceae bacterium HL-DH14]WNH12335.1 hypothetical protein RHP49_15760 [Flavobacteriaceae bacterium HL-DH10]